MHGNEKSRGLLRGAVGAVLSNPIVFFYVFRWLTWLLSVGLLYTKTVPSANAHYEPGLWMYAAFQLFLGLLYSAVLYPRLHRTSGSVELERPQGDLPPRA